MVFHCFHYWLSKHCFHYWLSTHMYLVKHRSNNTHLLEPLRNCCYIWPTSHSWFVSAHTLPILYLTLSSYSLYSSQTGLLLWKHIKFIPISKPLHVSFASVISLRLDIHTACSFFFSRFQLKWHSHGNVPWASGPEQQPFSLFLDILPSTIKSTLLG